MKFGIYSSIANPPRGGLAMCVAEVIEEARLAEQAGFRFVFLRRNLDWGILGPWQGVVD